MFLKYDENCAHLNVIVSKDGFLLEMLEEQLEKASSCSKIGSIRDDPYWTSRQNSLELIELSSIK